jgi:hypothetical protein
VCYLVPESDEIGDRHLDAWTVQPDGPGDRVSVDAVPVFEGYKNARVVLPLVGSRFGGRWTPALGGVLLRPRLSSRGPIFANDRPP